MIAPLKYRPSLTLDEIQFLLTHPAIHSNPALKRKLEVFTLKAEHGITKPSHVAVGRTSLEESLGFNSPSSDTQIGILLDIYHATPQLLSPTQLAKVQHHRYLNDMMTPSEEKEYERTYS